VDDTTGAVTSAVANVHVLADVIAVPPVLLAFTEAV
jgi:hypothetical protein